MTIVYATIWIAMLLFVAGESGRAYTPHGRKPPGWAAATFLAGCLVAIVHTIVAFDVAHDWSHADAVRDTAKLTKEMYGIDFATALYMNYLFLAVWLADAVWWMAFPRGYVRPALATWALRAFYMVFLFNAMVVFAADWRRVLGLVIISWLARIWSPGVLHSRPRQA